MQDPADTRFPRIAPILLIGALVGLAVFRPGFLGGESVIAYRFATTLIAVTIVGYIAWRFHGIPAAAAAIALLCVADPEKPVYAAFIERQNDALFLATLAIGIAAVSRQGKGGRWHRIVIAVTAMAIALFGWFGLEMPEATDSVARDRLRHVALGVGLLAFLLGLLARSASWLDRLKLVGATVGIPAIGITFARIIHGEALAVFAGGDWPALFSEWKTAFADGTWSAGSWAWTTAWVVALLMLIGLWRTIARGWKEWKRGGAPLAWLLAAAGLGAFAAIGARQLASGSLALSAIGALLSVFGVADLILALVERIELRPPDPGPSNIPRVT